MDTKEFKNNRGRHHVVDADDLDLLSAIVEKWPNITLRVLVEEMAKQTGKHFSVMTLSRALSKLGLSKVFTWRVLTTQGLLPEAEETRYQAIQRRGLVPERYPSSLTDYEWEALRPLVKHQGERGRPSDHDRRVMWDAVFFLIRGGPSCCALPAEFPTIKAVFAFFAQARDSGLLVQVFERLQSLWRERAHGRALHL